MTTPPVKAQSAEDRLNAHIGGGWDPVAGPPTLETWHSLGSPGITNFASDHARYRLSSEGYLLIDIQGHATGATTTQSANYANTMPAPYRPSIQRVYPISAAQIDTFYRIVVGTDGSVQIRIGVLANGNVVGGSALVPLD